MLLLWVIAHWENDDGHGNMSSYQKVSLPVACGRHLELGTTRLFFHIYCQYATKKVPTHKHVCKVVNYRTSGSGLKQINIVNQFGDGQSDVDRFMSKHRQTGSAKDRPCLGGHKKKQRREGTGVLAWMAIENRTKSSSQLTRECGIISTLDCPDQGLYSSGRSKNKTFFNAFLMPHSVKIKTICHW